MKIALVARGIYPFDFGGREIRIYQLARNFSKKHDVTVFVPDKEGVDYEKEYEGFEIFPIPYSPVDPRFLNSISGYSFARNVAKEIPEHDFDVVDILFYSMPFDSEDTEVIATLNVVLPAWRHVPTLRKIYTLPVIYFRVMLNFEKAHFADKVICVSDGAKNEAKKLGIAENKIEVVKNGVDSELFHPNVKTEVRETYGIDGETFLILYAGRLVEAKGVQDLIRAFSSLNSEINAKLMIVGKGKHEGFLKKIAPEDDTLFVGSQPYEKMPEFYKAADLFVLPSHWEVQPLGCVEAMACGTPVIATDVGGIPEIVENNKNGFLVKPGNSREIRKYLEKVYSNPNIRKKLVDNGLKFSENRKWGIIAEETLKSYKKS